MKVLVFPHHLELGGSQVNAVELAGAVRDHGHDVVVFGTPGPALELVHEQDLRFIAAPPPKMHPSPTMMRALRGVVRAEAPDIVHAWDWPQCLDAFYAVHLTGVPLVGSNMSMGVTRFLPRSIPLTYGTPALVTEAIRSRSGPVMLLEPPVDTQRNAPGAVDTAAFRACYELHSGVVNLVIVSRLIAWMKLEGIARALDVVARLAHEIPVRLIIVGGGDAHVQLLARAAGINQMLGRRVVILTGPMTDPRPAYAVADVVLGMGGSVLRGMAFAKPCVVLGEDGFSEPFTPETCEQFLRSGFFGRGDVGRPDGLYTQVRELVMDEMLRSQLGVFCRDLVERRFSVTEGAVKLDAFYRRAVDSPRSTRHVLLDGLHTFGHLLMTRTISNPARRLAGVWTRIKN